MRNKQLAARLRVRYDELGQALGKLAADDPRREQLTIELAAAKHDYQAAIAELGELDRLRSQAQVADARAIVDSEDDPNIAAALANVREHAANLDAQVKLDDELADPAPPPSPGKPKKTL